MTQLTRRTFTVRPPADRPDLLPHFEALAAENGFQMHFLAEDETSGESAIVRFDPGAAGNPRASQD